MIIDAISDLHGHYPQLEGGDLLIVAGDLVAVSNEQEYLDFYNWTRSQNYKKKIVIAGNHDTLVQREGEEWMGFEDSGFEYLCDSGATIYYDDETPTHPTKQPFKKLKIWGSPWTKTFPGMNPKCKAFTVDTEEELAEKWAKIPDDVDILVTHSAPWGILDRNIKGEHCGSKSLVYKVGSLNKPPKLWVWGHIHESYGIDLQIRPKLIKMINASHVNERYEPVNKPVRVIL